MVKLDLYWIRLKLCLIYVSLAWLHNQKMSPICTQIGLSSLSMSLWSIALKRPASLPCPPCQPCQLQSRWCCGFGVWWPCNRIIIQQSWWSCRLLKFPFVWLPGWPRCWSKVLFWLKLQWRWCQRMSFPRRV